MTHHEEEKKQFHVSREEIWQNTAHENAHTPLPLCQANTKLHRVQNLLIRPFYGRPIHSQEHTSSKLDKIKISPQILFFKKIKMDSTNLNGFHRQTQKLEPRLHFLCCFVSHFYQRSIFNHLQEASKTV